MTEPPEEGWPGSKRPGVVMTVTGPVQASELGVTLMHEHLFYRFWDVPARFDAAPSVEAPDFGDVIADEVDAFRGIGGSAIVDVTVRGIGRNPERLLNLSSRTQVHVVMGCGWYREPFYPPEDRIDSRSVDELSEELVLEFANGVGDARIRPGIIGEIGTHNSWVSAQEERVHRAAARASIRTGLPITTHSAGSVVGLRQLEIFCEEGVDPERVIIGHADTYLDYAYYHEILKSGATLQFDMIGMYFSEYTRLIANAVSKLIADGYREQLVLSHDICRLEHLQFAGGGGFVLIDALFLPLLRSYGVTDADIRTILVDNPRRILTVTSADDS